MLIKTLPRFVVVAALALAGSLSVQAQQSQTADSQKQQVKPAPAPSPAKPAMVWTDDNISSVRSAADVYAEQKKAADAAAAAARAASAAKPVPKPVTQDRTPATLSNPKTVEDADGMIAWESRDIAAQQQFLQELQKRIDAAPPDQRARLQQDLSTHSQTLAETQKERDTLIAQKQQLEKKAPAGSGTSSPNQQ